MLHMRHCLQLGCKTNGKQLMRSSCAEDHSFHDLVSIFRDRPTLVTGKYGAGAPVPLFFLGIAEFPCASTSHSLVARFTVPRLFLGVAVNHKLHCIFWALHRIPLYPIFSCTSTACFSNFSSFGRSLTLSRKQPVQKQKLANLFYLKS